MQKEYETSPDWIEFDLNDDDTLEKYIGLQSFGKPKSAYNYDAYDYYETLIIDRTLHQIQYLRMRFSFKQFDCAAVSAILFEPEYEFEKCPEKGTSEKPEANQNLTITKVTIFKVRPKGKKNEIFFVDYYRNYKSWEEYLNCNELVPCTMVFPKDGKYQPDPDQEITETTSSVLIEIRQSPASKKKMKPPYFSPVFLTYSEYFDRYLLICMLT